MMNKSSNQKKEIHICYICGKDIYPDDEQGYVKTRRGTEIRFHRSCIRRDINGSN